MIVNETESHFTHFYNVNILNTMTNQQIAEIYAYIFIQLAFYSMTGLMEATAEKWMGKNWIFYLNRFTVSATW